MRQDNAGCYHSNPTILAADVIEKSTGVHIKQIDFSDPQGGKVAADGLAAGDARVTFVYTLTKATT